VEGVGVGEKTESPFSFSGENDLRDLLVFYKNITPYGNELIKRDEQIKAFFDGLEEFRGGNFSKIKPIDGPILEIKEVRENLFRILKFFSLRELRKFFRNLEMVERENDIAQIKENDLNGRMSHSVASLPTLSPRGQGQEGG
jgi:hypothetical protein